MHSEKPPAGEPGAFNEDDNTQYTTEEGIYARLIRVGLIEKPNTPTHPAPAAPINATGYAAAALTGECETVRHATEGERNQTLSKSAWKIGRLISDGDLDADAATAALSAAALETGLPQGEIDKTIAGGLNKGMTKQYRPARSIIGDPEITEVDASELRGNTAADDDDEIKAKLIPGGTFILDGPDHTPAIWGAGDLILWARGESLIIVGPPGVGKTTLSGQVVAGLLGLRDEVLGLPITPARRVLYLAMDRPTQIRRSLRRTLGTASRDILDARLVVWPGPPIADVAKAPRTLLKLAQKADADVVVVDSLKDAAIGLTEDEVGAGYNSARQLCVASNVDLLELHHLTKRGPNGTRPTDLASVYGSAWITAGAGSVVLLWGQAGDPIVDLHHLKQPCEPFGPCKIIHDHTAGVSQVLGGGLVEFVRNAGPDGVTAKDAAAFLFETSEPTRAEVEKARRKLGATPGVIMVVGQRGGNEKQPTTWVHESMHAVTGPFTGTSSHRDAQTDHDPSQSSLFPQVSDITGHSHDQSHDSFTGHPPFIGGARVSGIEVGEGEAA